MDDYPLDCLQSASNLGNLYFVNKQWSEAINTYKLAISAIESVRNIVLSDRHRQQIIDKSIRVFTNITQSYVELNQTDHALTYAERSKSRNLTELLFSRELYPKGDVDPEIIEKLKEFRRRIPTLDRQLQVLEESNRNNTNPLTQQAREQISAELKQARAELDQVLEKIKPIDPTFTLTQTVQPITFAEIQDLLDDQTAIVEWYITEEKTFAFLITKDQAQPILHAVETEIIAEAVQKYLELYGQTHRFTKTEAKEQFAIVSKALCQALHLDQILEQLQQFDLNKLILIPHRQLHFLPFHALPLSDDRCLLDKFSAGVSYAPSCQLLQVLERQEKSANDHFFAIKNPTQDLLFSELEVEAISDYFPETDILDRKNASETNFRNHPNLEKLNCLHFSCHGTFDFQSPLNSALILNDDNEDNADNRLTLAEIFELNLPNCSLVSLSACETGITDLNSLGDEYVGLPSGFIYAGASAVISSLWPVSDLATSILMIQTYHYLKNGLPNQKVTAFSPSPFGFSFQGLDGSLQTGIAPIARTTETINSPEQLPTPAQALNAAQNWMRTLTPEKGQAFLDEISPIVKRRLPEKKAELYLNTLTAVLLKPESEYCHPYYWAAFTVVGI
ncbi:TPR repeat-containing protein [[Leptolyngbya] sp. PCC 7376]|uniref:CHAT domain-containing protein n=1 Tax=[Leptolyngbya] sp. PCC 7376 TaxID=111781 RepID=UPI00029EE033|nr:CHAT domain-containing protein [[Leptolyngbya] sp. PCC 7376]AFY38473.1 TPR repeat-containing protein [[Leptolyngbya] sp. PCC 7376]